MRQLYSGGGGEEMVMRNRRRRRVEAYRMCQCVNVQNCHMWYIMYCITKTVPHPE